MLTAHFNSLCPPSDTAIYSWLKRYCTADCSDDLYHFILLTTFTKCLLTIFTRSILMIRARDFSPLLGVVVCFLAASVTLYTTASSLSSRLEDGYVFLSIFTQLYLSVCYVYMYRRIPRLRPPFLHASIGQKWGGGLYAGS